MTMIRNDTIQQNDNSPARIGLQEPLRLGIIYQEESGRGLTHPFFVLILDAFKQRAEDLGCEITFINSHLAEKEEDYAAYCRAGRLDGVCLVCVDFAAPR